MALTTTELVVLGLVLEKPRHGYELDRVIDARGIRQWADVAFSSIYYVLTRLEARGLVASEQSGGAKSRRVFAGTTHGRDEAVAATARILEDPSPTHAPLVVGLAHADLLTEETFRELLGARGAALADRIAHAEAAREAQQPLPASAELVFSYALDSMRSEAAWLTSTLEGGPLR